MTLPTRLLSQNIRYRHPGCEEAEILGHILDYCGKREIQRNIRLIDSKHSLQLHSAKDWEVYEDRSISTDVPSLPQNNEKINYMKIKIKGKKEKRNMYYYCSI
mgnify:CR=1 FL=1